MQRNPVVVFQPIDAARGFCGSWPDFLDEQLIPVHVGAVGMLFDWMGIFMDSRLRQTAFVENFKDRLQSTNMVRMSMRQYDVGDGGDGIRLRFAFRRICKRCDAFSEERQEAGGSWPGCSGIDEANT